MRFIKKIDYDHDIKLFKYRSTIFWYAVLAVLVVAAPLYLDDYLLSLGSFVGIWAIAGVGLMLLSGYSGQFSLGHAAFLAVGAYTTAILEQAGVPFVISFLAAGLFSGVIGVLVGLPALRLSGIYLAIATLAFAFIIEEILTRWGTLTNGPQGMFLDDMDIAGLIIDGEAGFFYVVAVVLLACMVMAINLLRSPTGLAMIAIRDSETAAQSIGVNLARVKTIAFGVSAAFTGLAGAFYAHRITFISPEQFNIFVSIELLILIFIGGIGSMHGVIFGAIFVVTLPQGIAASKEYLPPWIAEQAGLESAAFGLLLLLFIIFEPLGIHGIWLKIKHYFSMFPLYRKHTFKREKRYAKGESW